MSRICLFSVVMLMSLSAVVRSQPLTLVNAYPNLTFTKPVLLIPAPDGTDRVFVVQQNGVIRVFPNDSTIAETKQFLDIGSRLSSSANEQGLLGLAFHPDFASNGFFFVNYTAPTAPPNACRTMISRFSVAPGNPDSALASSELPILEVEQPYANHNGGMIAFGPDNCLYIGMGDGGDGNDPGNVAQNRSSLLGKFLRIDIRDSTILRKYVIPQDNPYAGNTEGFREEIWAYGFRNPWRWSFDVPTGELWAGDVGQGAREEIDLVEKGGNYGWKIMEGTICRPPTTGCSTAGLILPWKDYPRTLGYSVTGGYVYRGQRRPEFGGAYIYGDYGSGRIWLLRRSGGAVVVDTLLLDSPYSISSFGVDRENELYVLSYSRDLPTSIYRFSSSTPTAAGSDPVLRPERDVLEQNYPNPFNPSTTILFEVAGAGPVSVSVHDLLGREVAVLVDGVKPAGRYSVTFDGSRMASGVYYYRLQTARSSQSRPLVLTR